jgi:hypothetical protein
VLCNWQEGRGRGGGWRNEGVCENENGGERVRSKESREAIVRLIPVPKRAEEERSIGKKREKQRKGVEIEHGMERAAKANLKTA